MRYKPGQGSAGVRQSDQLKQEKYTVRRDCSSCSLLKKVVIKSLYI